MINKVTVEKAWRHDPNKIYHVIQNPKIDKKKQNILGLTIKSVEYTVRDWDKKFVYFERVDKSKNKRFPEILSFDKRYPDAEDEVFADRVSKAKKKPDYVDSYGIFGEKNQAYYHKLMRLHRLAKELSEIHKVLKGEQDKSCGSCSSENGCDSCDSDDAMVKDAKKSTDKEKIDLSLKEIKGYFEKIQDTGYFEELDRIQSENPDLATM